MLNPSLCHWEATNWSVRSCGGEDVSVCANATDPKGISLILRASKQPWDLACMRVSICYLAVHMLSLTVLPENGAEDKSRGEVIHDSPVLLEERESNGETQREREAECFGILRR